MDGSLQKLKSGRAFSSFGAKIGKAAFHPKGTPPLVTGNEQGRIYRFDEYFKVFE